jgi:hypothetical protein
MRIAGLTVEQLETRYIDATPNRFSKEDPATLSRSSGRETLPQLLDYSERRVDANGRAR